MKLLLWLAACAAAAAPGMLSLPALHVKLAAPQGWQLNAGQARRGWVSFYGAKDPTDASIDVFYYGRHEERGTPEGYLSRLPAAESAAARRDSIGGRTVWIVASDYAAAQGFHTVKSRSTPHHRVLIVMGGADGTVVLRLRSLMGRSAQDEAVLRGLAASIQPL